MVFFFANLLRIRQGIGKRYKNMGLEKFRLSIDQRTSEVPLYFHRYFKDSFHFDCTLFTVLGSFLIYTLGFLKIVIVIDKKIMSCDRFRRFTLLGPADFHRSITTGQQFHTTIIPAIIQSSNNFPHHQRISNVSRMR
jgi:hypothetical protein